MCANTFLLHLVFENKTKKITREVNRQDMFVFSPLFVCRPTFLRLCLFFVYLFGFLFFLFFPLCFVLFVQAQHCLSNSSSAVLYSYASTCKPNSNTKNKRFIIWNKGKVCVSPIMLDCYCYSITWSIDFCMTCNLCVYTLSWIDICGCPEESALYVAGWSQWACFFGIGYIFLCPHDGSQLTLFYIVLILKYQSTL